MHELGIVLHVIEMAEQAAKESGAKKVTELDLEVGEVSTVVPDYFRDCYNWAIQRSEIMRGCRLNLVVIEGISCCRDCGATYKTTAHGRICPHCGSGNTCLVTGRDVVVRSIRAQ
ncbi:MAG: hydrogenase maturation nickel metallochaperone HypA [Lachnospiraceae bacterium]